MVKLGHIFRPLGGVTDITESLWLAPFLSLADNGVRLQNLMIVEIAKWKTERANIPRQ
jgi:hypothetical protein